MSAWVEQMWRVEAKHWDCSTYENQSRRESNATFPPWRLGSAAVNAQRRYQLS